MAETNNAAENGSAEAEASGAVRYEIWNFKYIDEDEEGDLEMRPYNGADSMQLLKELLDYYVEHAFEVYSSGA